MRFLSATATVGLLLLAGCMGDAPDTSSTTGGTGTGSTSSSATAAPPAPCLAENALRDRMDLLHLDRGTLKATQTTEEVTASATYAADAGAFAAYWEANYTEYATGGSFYILNGTGTYRHRDLAGGMAERLRDGSWGGLTSTAETSFFATLGHEFTASCVQEGGQAVHRLHRDTEGIQETWRFTANGTFLSATFRDRPGKVSGNITFEPEPKFPTLGANPVATALFRYTQHSLDANQVALVIEPTTPASRYSELRLQFLDDEDEVMASIPMSAPTAGEPGLQVLDYGRPGIVDDGDVWVVDYGPSASFQVRDAWSGTLAFLQDVPVVEETLPPLPDEDPETVAKSFSWIHEGRNHTVEVEIPLGVLRLEEGRRLPRTASGAAYDLLVHDARSQSLLADAAAQLQDAADEAGLDDTRLAALALSFVQSLPNSLPATRPDDRYLRAPAMTLANGGGDSEDNSVLLAALLTQLGHDAILLRGDRHTSVGVALEGNPPGPATTFKSVRYWQAEPTAQGPALGLAAPHLRAARPEPVDLAPRTSLVLDTELAEEGGMQRMTLQIRNEGRRDTARGEILVLLMEEEDGDLALARDTCVFPPMSPSGSYTCVTWLPPGGAQVQIRMATVEGMT